VPIIKFDTVSKEFSPESFGVREVSFEVEPGELLFITGRSGSGKTTLMRLLTKEYTPTSGDIFFHDEALSDIPPNIIHNHRRKIGVVFQDYRLISDMNVWENVALPLYVIGKREAEVELRVTDLLNLIKLPDKADQFPSQLSGGEAQRVSIARSLAMGPEVIFADEPTGNLDPETSKAISHLLRKINELGTTVLIATHDQDVMSEHKDLRQIILENGRLIKDTGKRKISGSQKSQPPSENQSDKAEKKPKVTENQTVSDSLSKETHPNIVEPDIQETPTEISTEQPSIWSKWFGNQKKEAAEVGKPTETSSQIKPIPAKARAKSKQERAAL